MSLAPEHSSGQGEGVEVLWEGDLSERGWSFPSKKPLPSSFSFSSFCWATDTSPAVAAAYAIARTKGVENKGKAKRPKDTRPQMSDCAARPVWPAYYMGKMKRFKATVNF